MLGPTVIHLEIGSSESRDSHSQKHASPSDKRVSPIQHFSSFPVQNALLEFVKLPQLCNQAISNWFPGSWVKGLEVKIVINELACFRRCFMEKNFFKITGNFGIFAIGVVRKRFIASTAQYFFYVEKCTDYADADVSKVCRSVSPNPVRCPVKRAKDIQQ